MLTCLRRASSGITTVAQPLWVGLEGNVWTAVDGAVVESTQVGLLWRVARLKMQRPDVDLFMLGPSPSAVAAAPKAPAAPAVAVLPPADPAKRKVKVDGVLA